MIDTEQSAQPETARVGCEAGERPTGGHGDNGGVRGVVSACKRPGTRLGRNASARAYPNVPHRPLPGTAAPMAGRRGPGCAAGVRKNARHPSGRQAEHAAPDSRSAPRATTPRTGRYHARFLRPGPRRGIHPSPVEIISRPQKGCVLIASGALIICAVAVAHRHRMG